MSHGEKLSLTQKYLSETFWSLLKKRTSFGTTIYDCCKSALENPDSNVGLYAPDPEAYDVFAELFHPIIAEYHKVDVSTLKSIHDLGDANNLKDLPQNYQDAIISTRVRVGRTVKGYPMAGKLTKEKRIELEQKIRDALLTLDGDLAGTYRSLIDMSKEEKQALIDEHILYNDGEDRFLASAGGYNDWPYGRGIFMNNDKNFIVWINEEDHIRIISMQKGASLKQVWGRLVRAIHAMETRLEFVCHPKFGHLTFCPTNIGTGLRASVHVRVPNTAASGKLDSICASMDLQPRGIHGEHTESVGGVYDISNKIRIGRTEWDLINTMWVGVEKLLDNEFGSVEIASNQSVVIQQTSNDIVNVQEPVSSPLSEQALKASENLETAPPPDQAQEISSKPVEINTSDDSASKASSSDSQPTQVADSQSPASASLSLPVDVKTVESEPLLSETAVLSEPVPALVQPPLETLLIPVQSNQTGEVLEQPIVEKPQAPIQANEQVALQATTLESPTQENQASEATQVENPPQSSESGALSSENSTPNVALNEVKQSPPESSTSEVPNSQPSSLVEAESLQIPSVPSEQPDATLAPVESTEVKSTAPSHEIQAELSAVVSEIQKSEVTSVEATPVNSDTSVQEIPSALETPQVSLDVAPKVTEEPKSQEAPISVETPSEPVDSSEKVKPSEPSEAQNPENNLPKSDTVTQEPTPTSVSSESNQVKPTVPTSGAQATAGSSSAKSPKTKPTTPSKPASSSKPAPKPFYRR